MDFELFAGFVSFVALMVVWAFAPKEPALESMTAPASALSKVSA